MCSFYTTSIPHTVGIVLTRSYGHRRNNSFPIKCESTPSLSICSSPTLRRSSAKRALLDVPSNSVTSTTYIGISRSPFTVSVWSRLSRARSSLLSRRLRVLPEHTPLVFTISLCVSVFLELPSLSGQCGEACPCAIGFVQYHRVWYKSTCSHI